MIRMLSGPVLGLLLALGAVPSASAVDSPVSKGSRIVAGSISFESRGGEFYEDDNGKRETEWRVLPGGGIFVADRLSAGLLIEILSRKQGGATDYAIGVGPQVKYFFPTGRGGRNDAFTFIGLDYLFGQYGRDTAEPDFQKQEYTLHSLKGEAGFIYMLSSSVGATLTLYYDRSWLVQREPEKGPTVGASRFGVALGFTTFLWE
jgi:hypothetical protein